MKFISYDGEYPNLCSGTMIVEKKNGTKLKIKGLRSCGCAGFNNADLEEYIEKGAWSIDKDQEWGTLSKKELKKITELANDNIECGCCGGCI